MKDYRTPPELAAALRALAERDSAAAPPPELESRLLAEFAAPRPPSAVLFPLARTAAAAALLLSAAALLDRPRPHLLVAETPFVQVPYVAPPAPYERTEIIRQNVPVAALIAAGFDVHIADSGGVIPADVLIGQDGRALAIRPVSASRTERSLD